MNPLDRSAPPAPADIRPFALPAVHRGALENGLAVLAARHGDMPLVTAQLVLEAGAARERASRSGLAYLTANTLDAGASGRSGAELAWEFEKLGVELEADALWDATLVRATTPARLLEPTLDLLADVVMRPTFPDTEVRRLRDEQASEILQRRKEPRALASDMAARLFYGEASPYGHPIIGIDTEVAALTRSDVEIFHRATYTPRGAALMLVGDVDVDGAPALARRCFGDWSGADASPVTLPGLRPAGGTKIFVVDRPDAVQSEIRVVQHGIARTHPDYFALQVMNTLLGGAFTSRLNLSLREKHGFTYGVRSGFAFRRVPGPFSISTAVGTEVTAPAVREILREVDLLRDSGAQEDEVERARDFLSGILPLEWQTTDQLAERLADVAIFDLPDDYFQTYRARIAGVAKADVDRVAREYLDTAHQAIVVIGSAEAIAGPLAELDRGPVETHPLEA